MTLRSIIHVGLHFAIPAALALIFFRRNATRAFLIMLSALVIDLDHLLATPLYDPNRCSIGFHPLHSLPAMVVYCALLLPKRTRLFGLGLVIHIALDALDCVWMGQEMFARLL